MARRGQLTAEAIDRSINVNTKEVDTRYFVPTPGQNGSVGVKIRLLPSPEALHPSFILTKKHHDIRENGVTILEKCPQALKAIDPHSFHKCPMCEEGTRLWQAGDEKQAKKRFAKQKYVSNIVIIEDPVVPSNNGKVFLYEFTKPLYDIIQKAMNPTTQIEKPVIVYDYEKGANLNLIGVPDTFPSPNDGKMIKFINYESSKFDAPTALPTEFIDYVDNLLIDLSPLLEVGTYKSYDELKSIYDKAFGTQQNYAGGIQMPSNNSFYTPPVTNNSSEGFIPSFVPQASSQAPAAPNPGLSFMQKLEAATKSPEASIPTIPSIPQIPTAPAIPQIPTMPTAQVASAPAVSTDAASFMERLKSSIASK